MKLKTPINIDKYPSLPTIGQTERLISQNTKMNLSGWGITGIDKSKEGATPSIDLHILLTTTLTKEQCKKDIYANNSSETSTEEL